MTFNLIDEAWLPVRRASGAVSWLRPADLVNTTDPDPPIAFAWMRPDLDAASMEFMIGLFSTVFGERCIEIEDWQAWWDTPPSPDQVHEHLAALRPAFNLLGDGPRFMQDLTLDDGSEERIAALLIDNPGENALKNNTDFFVKRGRIDVLSLPASAIALFQLQSYAPSGGAGHRVGLRGGGPVSCFAMPGDGQGMCLWHNLWLNFYTEEAWWDAPPDQTQIFPWMVACRDSKKGLVTTPVDCHPAHVFWGMPRRIRLNVADNIRDPACGLTGQTEGLMIGSYHTKPYGNNYEAWGGHHPLTPHYRKKPADQELWPLHPQIGQNSYKDWLGVLVVDEKGLRVPARIVRTAQDRLNQVQGARKARLVVTGFDMDNMKARGFVEQALPVLVFEEPLRTVLDLRIRHMIEGAREVANALSFAISLVLKNVGHGKGIRWSASEQFWRQTEPEFLALLEELPSRLRETDGEYEPSVERHWLTIIGAHARRIFDEAVPPATVDDKDPEAYINARKSLQLALHGYGKNGRSLFEALNIPQPQGKPKKQSKKKEKAA